MHVCRWQSHQQHTPHARPRHSLDVPGSPRLSFSFFFSCTPRLPRCARRHDTHHTNLAATQRTTTKNLSARRSASFLGDIQNRVQASKLPDSNLARRPRSGRAPSPRPLRWCTFVLPPLPRRSKPRDSVPVHRPTRCPAAVAQCCRGLRVGVCTCTVHDGAPLGSRGWGREQSRAVALAKPRRAKALTESPGAACSAWTSIWQRATTATAQAARLPDTLRATPQRWPSDPPCH